MRWLPLASGTVLTIIILAMMGRDYPLIGHDFRYFMPRLVDTALHVKQNGWVTQWYSPTFGGGLPAFPNPHHLQYTLVQALTVVFNPWWAILISTAMVTLAGFAACVALCRRHLQLCTFSSTLCAIFFCGNGFYLERMMVGHLNYQLFPLTSCLLLLLLNRSRGVVINAAALGLLVAAIVYNAGYQLIIMIAVSLCLTIAILEVTDWLRLPLRRVLVTVTIGIGWSLAICAVKVHAVLSLMQQFPREITDVYNVSVSQALVGFVAQFSTVMVLTPLFWLARLNVAEVPAGLVHLLFGRQQFGVWEVDMSLSPVLLLCLFFGAVQLASRWRGLHGIGRRRQVALGVTVVLVWIAVDMTLARGFWHWLLQPLPILRSLHVNVRYAAVFLFPLAIVGAKCFDGWELRKRYPKVAGAAFVLALLSPTCYYLLPGYLQRISFDLTTSLVADARVRAGERLDVTSIENVSDAAAVANNVSSLLPYEPLFGYYLEDWTADVTVGPINEVVGGKFNMTNPSSLVFPYFVNLRPFDRIAESDRRNLEAFASRRVPDWPLPPVTEWLIVLAHAGWTSACLIIAIQGMRSSFSRLRPFRGSI